MKTKLNILLSACILLSSAICAQDGPELFKKNCGVCHTVGKGKLVGPDLKDVHNRYKEDWLTKWIKSSQTLVKKGDPVAVKLFEANAKLVMPDQNVTDDQIKTILSFVKAESEKTVEVAASGEKPKEVATASNAKPEPYDYHKTGSNDVSWKAATFALAGFSVILIIIIIALANTIGGMAKGIYNPTSDNSHTTPRV